MTPYVTDSDFTLYVGDVRDCLRELPDQSVHTVVTSPPYWGLRDYSTDGQIGLEPTPEAFVAAMVDVFREVRRVLRDDGTLWLNLGDSYNANQGAGFNAHEYTRPHLSGEGVGQKRIDEANRNTVMPSGLPAKNLMGMPWRVAFALQQDGWILRSDIIWAKPNPMPESVTDRPTKAHEYVFLLSKSPRYFFDQEAVREPAEWAMWGAQTVPKYNGTKSQTGWMEPKTREERVAMRATGRNVRSVWEIATQPYPDAHFATFPEALPERCIKAGTSERGCCPECGAPWTRQVELTPEYAAGVEYAKATRRSGSRAENADEFTNVNHGSLGPGAPRTKQTVTTGWTATCGHDLEPAPCTVLDPFMGSGTTALVARRLGRHSIGVELNPEYAALCARRLQQLSLLA